MHKLEDINRLKGYLKFVILFRQGERDIFFHSVGDDIDFMILNFTQTLLDQVSIKMLQIMGYDWNHFSKTILDVIIMNEVPLCMHLSEGCGIYFHPGTMAGGIDSSALHFLCLLYLMRCHLDGYDMRQNMSSSSFS